MNPAYKLVRWILVVTLGCSLGLLLVFILRSSGFYPEPVPAIQIVHRVSPTEAPFKISEDNLEQELQRVVGSQLAAFRADDYPKAFEFAASSIKAQMSLPAFERMVKNGFPGIAHNSAAQFGFILDNGDHALVNVTLISAGQTHHYQYVLQHERAGWKVAGVVEVKSIGMTI
jgi:hypothetical protein